ncbi:Glycine cleavage system transcriptional activator [Roseovarius albus]|uniref:Glycine cleavage system transcriptional activator n=1 Tax=Roseovarius albus TaxID=1247867 RepID=A0A1X6Z7J1_9RHOB|nr:LysR substrate-binding domain-containing protein [Roseovarius albus]SLN42643.1 Glycine cleavage system transcriptional activator [Roseovarius albus]
MRTQRKSLPPLDYFLAFEVTGRTGSFAAAARELNISESAVSRKVKLLEEYYQANLFVRGHRSITITSEGADLLQSSARALNILRDASQDLMARHEANPVSLAATNSVASLWLMPRLNRFSQEHPDVKIGLFSSDDDEECLAETNDLIILRGSGDWPGFEAELLFGETIFPVCSPQYLEQHGSAATAESIAQLDLIEVSNLHTEWMNWAMWLQRKDIPREDFSRTTQFNTYPLAIQAALDGLGIALGWKHLVDHLIEQGRLVRPLGNMSVRTRGGYYLLVPQHKVSFPERETVRDWLQQLSATRDRYLQ